MNSIEWLINKLNLFNQIKNDYINKLIIEQAKEMHKRDTALFLRWFTKHYTTTNDGQSFGWANSMGEGVTIEQIMEHYYSK